MYRLFLYFLFIYLIYRGIMFLFRVFKTINKGNSGTSKDNASSSVKSKFKDVEEAHFTEIKDDKKKDSH